MSRLKHLYLLESAGLPADEAVEFEQLKKAYPKLAADFGRFLEIFFEVDSASWESEAGSNPPMFVLTSNGSLWAYSPDLDDEEFAAYVPDPDQPSSFTYSVGSTERKTSYWRMMDRGNRDYGFHRPTIEKLAAAYRMN